MLGHRDEYGMQACGGSDAVRFFVSGDLAERARPVQDAGLRAGARSTRIGHGVRDEWMNPEAFQQQNLRANLNAALTPKFDLT